MTELQERPRGAASNSQAEENGSRRARIAAVAAVLLAAVAAGIAMFGGDGGYAVTARFQNASQLVPGNEVRIGGVTVGAVESLELAPDGYAQVELSVEGDHSPLQRGTRAVIRQTSLSGIANRYVDLQLPAGSEGGEIEDGGAVPADETEAAVELDQLFNALDERTRERLQAFIKGSARMWRGRSREANRGYRYLDPALSASRRLFDEASADTAALESFVTDSARLVTAVAERREDLAALVSNAAATTRAAGADTGALAEVLERTPDFMRRANTTFVNLRATLDDLDPLVEAGRPAARSLQDLLPELRGFTADAEPAIRDLSRTLRRAGGANDLVDLLRTFPPLTRVAVDTRRRNGERRPGSFPATDEALREAAPLIAHGRPYTPDFFGWADDFSHSGAYDALGGFSRTQTYFNVLSASVAGETPVLQDLEDRPEDFLDVAEINQLKRCPGAAEAPAPDGSNVWSEAEQEALDCREADRATEPAGGG